MRHFLFSIFFLLMTFIISAQDIIEVSSTGHGNSKEQAINSALKTALNQFFGLYVSSDTKISGESLVFDNVTSLNKGVIVSYDIISENNFDNSFFIILKARISMKASVDYFGQNKRYFSFNADAFYSNLQIQEFNKKNEAKTIQVASDYLKFISDRSFNYSIELPKMFNKNIEITKNIYYNINISANQNFKKYIELLDDLLSGISCSKSETEALFKQNEKVYPVAFRTANKKGFFFLRSQESIKCILDLHYYLGISIMNFEINNGYRKFKIFDIFNDKADLSFCKFSVWDYFQVACAGQSLDKYKRVSLFFESEDDFSLNSDDITSFSFDNLQRRDLNYFQFYPGMSAPNNSFSYLILNKYFDEMGAAFFLDFSEVYKRNQVVVIKVSEQLSLRELENISDFKIYSS